MGLTSTDTRVDRTRVDRTRVGAALLALSLFGLSACATATASSASSDASGVDRLTESFGTKSLTQQVPVATVSDDPPPSTPDPVIPVTSIDVAEPATPEPTPVPVTPAAFSYVPLTPVAVPAADIPLVAVGQSDGDETARVQTRLLELGFWLQATDGDYGLTTSQAVMAFQKFHGLDATASVDEQTAALLSAGAERATGLADAGTLVEIDKARQLLFIVEDGLAVWTLNSSTGSEVPYEAVNDKDPTKIEKGDAVTPVGLYHTERERPDGWWAGDLGEIYRPKYFVGGIAVHGSNSIPNYPASHGCVRVSVPAMDFIWESDLMPLGINVWVHGEVPAA